ncbi:MAG: aminopeptidase P N-terminal domain-containing protein [Candidatus Saccharimonadales bacterium]|nr:aminopeptidase P N-terminal domain-containing protein [Candidatus Saccharimonadales bacterium]
MLGAPFHTNNRRLFQKELRQGEVIIITAHSRVQKSADQFYFSQQRDFYYLTGINQPDWLLVVTAGEEFLVAPKLSDVEMIFDGGLDRESASKFSGVKEVLPSRAGWQKVNRILKSAKEVQTLLVSGSKVGRAYRNPAFKALARKLKSKTAAPILSIHPQLHDRRAIKQPAEIKALQQAIDITGDTLEEVKSQLSQIESENQFESMITAGFRSRGAAGHAYDPIVAGGLNACTLHYIDNNHSLRAGELALIDVGAEVDYYSADITRVWARAEPSPLQVAVHDAVNRVRSEMIKTLRPGLKFAEYFHAFDEVMGEQLVKLKLLKKPTPGGVRRFCPHGVSHFLGLDTHDVAADYKVFKENMVLTVEPGIYLPEERLGIRIEDNVLISKNGARNLSSKIETAL